MDEVVDLGLKVFPGDVLAAHLDVRGQVRQEAEVDVGGNN